VSTSFSVAKEKVRQAQERKMMLQSEDSRRQEEKAEG
jgi:hypothetical protein